MEIFRFDRAVGKLIDKFQSQRVAITPIHRDLENVSIGCIHIEAGGVLGAHEAIGDQLFLVITGSGTVSGAEGKRWRIEAGQAAFWRAGELHETTSEAGLSALVVEGAKLTPEKWMKRL